MPSGMPHMTATVQEVYRNVSVVLQGVVSSLDLPNASDYWSSCRLAATDVMIATKSTSRVVHLTLKPILLSLWFLSKLVWILTKFLGVHLFRHAYLSMRHFQIQMKISVMYGIQWQRSLSRAAVGLELALVGFGLCCFLLRRYIQKKKYVQRTRNWYRRTKRRITRKYNKLVLRISQTSLFLAMLFPHLAFGLCVVGFKVLLPRVVTFIATETLATLCLSFWYPFICTIALLHQWRNFGSNPKETTEMEALETQNETTPVGFYPKTTPKPKRSLQTTTTSPSMTKWVIDAMTPASFHHRRRAFETQSQKEEAEYWLQYWVVYALFTTACRLLDLIPLWSRVVGRLSPNSFLHQVELIFYVWIFLLPKFIVTSPQKQEECPLENRPLQLLHDAFSKPTMALVDYTSNAIPASLWEKGIAKFQSLLDLLVLVKAMSEETKNGLVHVVQESAPFLPPAVTLFMPGFLTEFGVLYVKSVVPSAKSARPNLTMESTMSLLEYWILHGIVAGLLSWWSPILWWIPFSTHGRFVLWCHLQIPATTKAWYNVWETELDSFGLLSRDGKVELQVENTVTARVLKFVYKSLPSAVQDDNDKDQEEPQPNATPEEPTEVEPDNHQERNVVVEDTPVKAATLPRHDNGATETNKEGMPRRRRRQRRRQDATTSSSSEDYSSSDNGQKPLRRSTRRRKPLRVVNHENNES